MWAWPSAGWAARDLRPFPPPTACGTPEEGDGHVNWETPLGFGVSSGEFLDSVVLAVWAVRCMLVCRHGCHKRHALILMYKPVNITANLCTKILDFRGSDSSRISISRDGIIMSIGDLPESLSQAIIVGIILVGRLGVDRQT